MWCTVTERVQTNTVKNLTFDTAVCERSDSATTETLVQLQCEQWTCSAVRPGHNLVAICGVFVYCRWFLFMKWRTANCSDIPMNHNLVMVMLSWLCIHLSVQCGDVFFFIIIIIHTPTHSSSGKTEHQVQNKQLYHRRQHPHLFFFFLFFCSHLLLAPECEEGRASARMDAGWKYPSNITELWVRCFSNEP